MDAKPPIVCFPFTGDTVGGSHVSASLLMRSLNTCGNWQPVAVSAPQGDLWTLLTKRGLAISPPCDSWAYDPAASLPRTVADLASVSWQRAKMLHALGASIVHTNDARTVIGWAAAARLAGCRLVHHQRTRWAPSRLLRLAVGLSDRILAISSYTRASLPPTLQDRAVILHNPFSPSWPGLSREDLRCRLAAAFGIPEQGPWVLFVGTLQQQKRPLVFAEAAVQLAASAVGGTASFLMAGKDGDAAGSLTQWLDHSDIAARVFRLGYYPAMEELLAAADLLLAPAVNEGHGRVLIEAALADLPVVAARSGGHEEIVRDRVTGLLVPPDDPQALANAAASLLAEPEQTRAMVCAARADALARFSADSHVAAVEAEYRRLCPNA